MPVEVKGAEGDVKDVLYGVLDASGDDVVAGLLLLEHEPHGFDVVLGVAPVALSLDITEDEFVDFVNIQDKLNKISRTADSLQLWIKNMIAEGKIDEEKLKEAKS